MVMISSHNGNGIGTVHDDVDDSGGSIHGAVAATQRRAMSDCLQEVSVVSSSPVSPSSRNRSQGFPLCNSRTQLLRMNTLYEDNEEQDLNHSRDYSELDKSREIESDFYLNLCMSREEGKVSSPLYHVSSSSSTASSSCDESDENDDSDFLIEARESLLALQEWQHQTTIDSDDGDGDSDSDSHDYGDDNVSNCDASCNSSYDGNADMNKSFETHSACGYDEFNGINNYDANPTPRSCPNLPIEQRRAQTPRHHVSAKSWLQEMKDDDLQQRQRIADAIAASSKGNADTNTPTTMRTRIGSKSILKSGAKFFRNKENYLENSDHKNNNASVSKQKQGKTDRPKTGRQKLMNSLLLDRPWQSSSSRRQRRKNCEAAEDDHREDNNNNNVSISGIVAAMETESPIVGKKVDSSPAAPTNGKESELKRAFFGNSTRASSTGSEKKFDFSSPSPTSNSKDLQLKRALFGNARVVTMDGIVESFADVTTPTSGSPDEHESCHRSSTSKFAPTSDAPLSWV